MSDAPQQAPGRDRPGRQEPGETGQPRAAPAGEPDGGAALFEAILRPRRSLDGRGFAIVMGVLAGASMAIGAGFFLAGAWPVAGFLGLDLALIYLAFRLSYRVGTPMERLVLTATALEVARFDRRGAVRRFRLQPYWLRVCYDPDRVRDAPVLLRSHGRSLAVGAFLSRPEKRDLAAGLRAALLHCRRPAGAAPAG